MKKLSRCRFWNIDLLWQFGMWFPFGQLCFLPLLFNSSATWGKNRSCKHSLEFCCKKSQCTPNPNLSFLLSVQKINHQIIFWIIVVPIWLWHFNVCVPFDQVLHFGGIVSLMISHPCIIRTLRSFLICIMFRPYICLAKLKVFVMVYLMSNAQKHNSKEINCCKCEKWVRSRLL
jgi:hypothetical protein